MKKIFIILSFLSVFFLTSCDKEFLPPTRPVQEEVIADRAGIIAVTNGLQLLWSSGRQSPVYTTVTATGFTTKELKLLNAGNADEAELLAGGNTLSSKNGLTNNLWSQCLIIKSESQRVLNNLNVLTIPTEQNNVKIHASIYKAMALATLVQYFEKVPIQIAKNASFNTKAEVLAEAINTLKSVEPILALAVENSNGFSGLVGTIKYKNTVYALLARYYLMAGDNNNALTYANLVDLTSVSTLFYDTVRPNAIAFSSILTNNVYQPIDNTTLGLPTGLFPAATDGRLGFYTKLVSTTDFIPVTTVRAKGFFDNNEKLILVYLPSEMTLIKAEAFARKNMLPEAVVELNKILTRTTTVVSDEKAATYYRNLAANLPAYSGAIDQTDILTEIFKNRCLELYMSGLKLEDSKRFGRPVSERNRNFYPYPDSERFNNTNTPTDPTF